MTVRTHWTSYDPALGIRSCEVISVRGRKTLIRYGLTTIEVPSRFVHDTRQEAFCADRRVRALKYWQSKLKHERETDER